MERKNTIDPEKFFLYYEANGWITGKVKMSNWKAAVRYWERIQKENKKDEPETSYDVKAYENMTQDDVFRALGMDV